MSSTSVSQSERIGFYWLSKWQELSLVPRPLPDFILQTWLARIQNIFSCVEPSLKETLVQYLQIHLPLK